MVDHAQNSPHLNQYYADERRLRVSRFKNSRGERFHFGKGCWVYDQELYDILVGELWLDEITEEEAMDIIVRRSKELGLC